MQKRFTWERYFCGEKLNGKNYGVLVRYGKNCAADNSIIDDEASNACHTRTLDILKLTAQPHANGMDGNYYTGGKDDWRR